MRRSALFIFVLLGLLALTSAHEGNEYEKKGKSVKRPEKGSTPPAWGAPRKGNEEHKKKGKSLKRPEKEPTQGGARRKVNRHSQKKGKSRRKPGRWPSKRNGKSAKQRNKRDKTKTKRKKTRNNRGNIGKPKQEPKSDETCLDHWDESWCPRGMMVADRPCYGRGCDKYECCRRPEDLCWSKWCRNIDDWSPEHLERRECAWYGCSSELCCPQTEEPTCEDRCPDGYLPNPEVDPKKPCQSYDEGSSNPECSLRECCIKPRIEPQPIPEICQRVKCARPPGPIICPPSGCTASDCCGGHKPVPELPYPEICALVSCVLVDGPTKPSVCPKSGCTAANCCPVPDYDYEDEDSDSKEDEAEYGEIYEGEYPELYPEDEWEDEEIEYEEVDEGEYDYDYVLPDICSTVKCAKPSGPIECPKGGCTMEDCCASDPPGASCVVKCPQDYIIDIEADGCGPRSSSFRSYTEMPMCDWKSCCKRDFSNDYDELD